MLLKSFSLLLNIPECLIIIFNNLSYKLFSFNRSLKISWLSVSNTELNNIFISGFSVFNSFAIISKLLFKSKIPL